MSKISYRQEIYRKLIHISSLWMPLSIWFLSKELSLMLLVAALGGVVVFELIRRMDSPPFSGLINKLFSQMLRGSEGNGLTGAFYMLLGAVITTLIFPKEIAVTALCVLMISDSFAALVGKRWGKIKIGEKSLEGSLSFFVSALAISAFVGIFGSYNLFVFFISAIFSCIAATICELYAKRLKIDDNLLIPLSFSVVQVLSISIFNNFPGLE